MANLKVTLELDSQGYVRSIKAADDATKQFNKDAVSGAKDVDRAFDSLSGKADKLFTGMTKLKAALVGAALVSFGRSAIAAADSIADLADATDMAIPKIIEIQNALIASGGKADDASKLITTFYKSIDEAAQGSDKTQLALGRLGISFDMLKNATPTELFDQAAKGLKGIDDPAQKTALAIDIFGKSMIGVSPAKFAEQLETLRGTFEKQAADIERAAALNDLWEQSIFKIRLAFLEAFAPMIQGMAKLLEQMPNLITGFKILAAVIVGVFVATGLRSFVTLIGSAVKGVQLLASGLSKVRDRLTGQIVKKAATPAERVSATGAVAGGIGLAAGVVGTAVVLNLEGEKAEAVKKTGDELQKQKGRAVEIGKELQSQLNAVQNLADGYRKAAQANMDRYTLEVEMLGKSKEEQDIIKGTADINKRYADQTAALEEKRKGAKGATLALINKEIGNLEQLRTSELDIFNISKEQTTEYARQQEQVKNIVAYMEQMAKAQEEIASFASTQDAARTSAFEQVKAQQEAFDLLGQREQLEKSIMNMRGSDQDNIKKLFDLEEQRKTQLEAIQKIQNLPFEGVGGMQQRMQEINDLYDARRVKIEETAAATKAEQESFAYGWMSAGEKFRNNIKTDAEYAAQQFSNFTKGFEDAFVKFVQTGKLSIKDLANSMIADFARVQAQKMLAGLFGGGAGGGFLGGIGKIFGFANGGMPPVGQASIVGERGPELFVPQSAGRIIPNHALGGGGGETQVINNAVTYSIQAVDAQSFKTLLARDPEFLHNVSEQGRRSMPIRSRR
jgi:lambda family phage tail tape measure protein